MHEYSIVQALLDQCDQIAQQNESECVTKVVVKIGVLSGVEVYLLQTAFDTFKEETVCHNAKLVINEQKVKLHCNQCGHEYEVDDLEYTCIICQSDNVKLIDGEDMYLMSLEME